MTIKSLALKTIELTAASFLIGLFFATLHSGMAMLETRVRD